MKHWKIYAAVAILLAGFGAGYLTFHSKKIEYAPNSEIKRLDSVNLKLADSIVHMNEKIKTTEASIAKQDSIINQKTNQYAKLRNQINNDRPAVDDSDLRRILTGK